MSVSFVPYVRRPASVIFERQFCLFVAKLERVFRAEPLSENHAVPESGASAAQVPAPDDSASAKPLSWLSYLPLALVILLSVVLRAGIVSIPLERDEGEYAYIAQRWLAGDVPYRDAFDQKYGAGSAARILGR